MQTPTRYARILGALDRADLSALLPLMQRHGPAHPEWLDLCRWAALNGQAADWAGLQRAARKLADLGALADWDESPQALVERATLQVLSGAGADVLLPGLPGGENDVTMNCRDAALRSAARRNDDTVTDDTRWLPPGHDSLRLSCELPVLLVNNAGAGIVASLRLTRVAAPGAYLRLVPAPAQAMTPLVVDFARALRRVTVWLRSVLTAVPGLPLQDLALAWDLTPLAGNGTARGRLPSLSGDSAGAACALGALWLLQEAARLDLAELLGRVPRDTLMRTAVTASLDEHGTLGPVGGALAKAEALAPLLQAWCEQGLEMPLHVHRHQQLPPEPLAPRQVPLQRHGDLPALLLDLAARGEPLSSEQAVLHGALLGDEERPIVPAPVLRAVLHQPATTLRQYALRCWAQWEDDARGPVHAHFVPLSVAADKSGRFAELLDSKPYDNLAELLHQHDTAGHDAYVLRGAPGAGKSTLLRHHLQATCRQALRRWARNQAPAELPVYLELSELPARCAAPGDDDEAAAAAVRDWLWRYLKEQTHAPEALLRLLKQGGSERLHPPLRLLLDGLNELRVQDGQQREWRAAEVVGALLDATARPLPPLLSVRQQHFDTLARMLLLRVDVQPWQVHHVRDYLALRFGETVARARFQALKNSPGALELCSTPMHLALQCELWAEGHDAPADDRAALYAAWLWLRLRRELGLSEYQPREPNPVLRDPWLLDADAHLALAQAPAGGASAWPRPHRVGGALMAGLLLQAERQYWADAEDGRPAPERCAVAVPWADVLPDADLVGLAGLASRAGARSPTELRGLWRQAVAALGLLTSPRGDMFKFSHQSWGEYLASCRLLARPPEQMQTQAPQELQRLLQHLQPPALPRTDLQEWQHLRQQVVDRWQVLPDDFWPGLLRSGLTLSLQGLRRELVDEAGWPATTADERLAYFAHADQGVLQPTGVGDEHRVDLQRWGDAFGVQRMLGPDDGPWHRHPLGLQAFLRQWLWRPLERRVWAQVETRIGAEAMRALREDPGHLAPPPLGDLHEVLTLALQGLEDPRPWLRHLMAAGHAVACARAAATWQRRAEPARARAGTPARVPELQHLRRLLLLQSVDAGGAVKDRLRAGGVLLALQPPPQPTLPPALQAHWRGSAYGSDGELAFQGAGQDLRARLQAGEALGWLGDTLRFEDCSVQAPGRGGVPELRRGLRLRAPHWVGVGRPGGTTRHRIGDRQGFAGERHQWHAELRRFSVAAYPVTVAEYRCFVDGGGYDPDQPWWGPPSAAGRQWLARAGRRAPENWGHALLRNPLQPVVGITVYEALAYVLWTAPLFSDWQRSDGLQPALPTEVQWEAAARWGQSGSGGRWPHGELGSAQGALDFNHGATRWGRPSPVGVFSRSLGAAGVSDLAGNVWEWCSNRYSPTYETTDDRAAASTPAPADDGIAPRALRGGGFDSSADYARAGCRDHVRPDLDDGSIFGLRLVRA